MTNPVRNVSGSDLGSILADIRASCPPTARIVFVSGNFNIIHPGHLRLLNFAAECGDRLVVGVNGDNPASSLLREDLRLEGVRSIGVVDHAFILRVPPETLIAELQPDIVVKGKEYEFLPNRELPVIERYGGKLLFSSGDVRFSSLDLLRKELQDTNFSNVVKPTDFPERHGFRIGDLLGLIARFSQLRVVVVGDLIVDEYITCEALGMSQEDPTLVVSPIKSDRFIGGAGIVAAHARGLGSHVDFFCVAGADEVANYATEVLTKYGLRFTLFEDESRPTTLKQRYRANNKTLLRVSHLRQHDISRELVDAMYQKIRAAISEADLLVFSDFNYGCLPQPLVEKLTKFAAERGVTMVADSQTSSQIGDVSRFHGMRLLTPTEHEARLAVRDFKSGLVVLAEALRQRSDAENLLVTLGSEGLLIHAPDTYGVLTTDRLPALNTVPKDVSGAGDSLFTCTALSLSVGADIWRSAYLGAIAAAVQVSRIGNIPLTADELRTELLM